MFRIPQDGGRVLWEITNRCNYACKYCIFSSGKGSIKEELSFWKCIKTIDDLWSHNFQYLKITGGEPFLRDDLVEIIEYAIKKGMKVDVSTNASMITLKQAKKLSGLKLEMIHVSLDGDKEVHEKVRGINTYDKTITGIKNLKESHQYIRIGTVLYKENQNRILEMIRQALELKVSEIIFSIMEPVGRMKGDNSYVITRPLKAIEEEILRYQREYKNKLKINYNWSSKIDEHIETCPAGRKFIYMNHKGNIAPCSWLVTLSSTYLTKGTLKEKNLNQLFQEETWKKFMEKKKCGDCVGRHKN